MGLGQGNLKYVAASTSDLVFGMICEEMGVLCALIIAASLAALALYAVTVSSRSRSTLYSIASCSAAGMMVFQACLNIFGATDILPLTGVTLPFISMGGSSLMSVWALLAFYKASDDADICCKEAKNMKTTRVPVYDRFPFGGLFCFWVRGLFFPFDLSWRSLGHQFCQPAFIRLRFLEYRRASPGPEQWSY